jgi:hypothetical protein
MANFLPNTFLQAGINLLRWSNPMKLQRVFGYLILFLSCYFQTSTAQPYYYYDSPVSDVRYARVYRTNLLTGQEELFMPDSMRITNIWSDPSQKWIYIDERGYIMVVNADNPSITQMPLGTRKTGGLAGARYFPRLNRLYISWIEGTDGVGTTATASFDATSFALVDSSLPFIDSEAIVSEDESMVYQYGVDSLGNRSLDGISTSSNTIVESRPFINVGPPTDMKLPHGGANGKILIGYRFPEEAKTIYAHYQVVDLATNAAFPAITLPWKCEAYLSGDAKTIVVEEVSLALSPLGNRRYRPGRIYIFDASTGKLRQRLTLPPDGVVMLFETYPERFFYFNKLTMQSLSGNVTVVTPGNVLLDTLISLKHQAITAGWLVDRNFLNELDNHLENAQKHLARGDSVNARKEIEKFQEKVDKEYQKTSDDQKKGKAPDKRFVTEEGWKLLYFNAQYIIDRLPEKSKK